MNGNDAIVISRAEQELAALIGTPPQDNPAVRMIDLEALSEDECTAEVANKEQVARFSEKMAKQRLKQHKEEHELRKRFMPYVYWLVVGVIGSTIALLIAAGCVNANGYTFLSDKVLMTLLTATVADILGIFYIAIRWLYPKSK